MNKRRANLTPPAGTPVPGLPPTRRAGGARREASARVTLTDASGAELAGWALNISRGGLRAIVEEHVELGAEFDIGIGEEAAKRRGRIVWIQEEPDGAIVGIEFMGGGAGEGGAPEPPPADDDAANE
ncbi:MAG TPA: PilZ domain-containing protein [Minicystis sp.]|nr:PilZ domain-containing protein [Minicystis sp.]